MKKNKNKISNYQTHFNKLAGTLFFVQIKENKKNGKKYLISIFSVK